VINKVILIGNLGSDPELRHTQNGTAVANFSIATSEKFKDKNGDRQERTEWHRIVAWDKLGELCGEYLTKGRSVYVEGKIQTRKWQDRNGVDKYTTEIIAREIKFLGSKSQNDEQGTGQQHAPPPPPYNPNEDVPF